MTPFDRKIHRLTFSLAPLAETHSKCAVYRRVVRGSTVLRRIYATRPNKRYFVLGRGVRKFYPRLFYCCRRSFPLSHKRRSNVTLSQVATQVKWARSSGVLPPPDLRDVEPPAQEPGASFHDLEQEGERTRGGASKRKSGCVERIHTQLQIQSTDGLCLVKIFRPLS